MFAKNGINKLYISIRRHKVVTKYDMIPDRQGAVFQEDIVKEFYKIILLGIAFY